MPTIFPYHRQKDSNACGPACAVMILDFLVESGFSGFKVLQSGIDSWGTKPSVPKNTPGYPYNSWATRPDEFEQGLDGYNADPANSANQIDVDFIYRYFGDVPIQDFRKLLIDSLQGKLLLDSTSIGHPIYPIVPIHGSFFYYPGSNPNIAADGYSDKITSVTELSKSNYPSHWIQLFIFESGGFIANDPYFRIGLVPEFGPDAHDRKGCCDNHKTVLLHFSGSTQSTGSALSPFEKNFPELNSVAILYLSKSSLGKRRQPEQTLPGDFPPARPRQGRCANKVLKLTDVVSQMRSFGLFSNLPTANYLDKTHPSTSLDLNWGTPRLIRRLDAKCNDYYLIPLYKRNADLSIKESNVMVRVDASTGSYLDSLYYSENPLLIDQTSTTPNLMQYISDQFTNMKKPRWQAAFDQQINEPTTEMIWLPCQQSISPFFPFYVITVKATSERFFVRLDGRVFEKLFY